MSGYVMTAGDATALLGGLAEHGVDACVGGGWAVDALLGTQTREHADLDLWVPAPGLEPLFVAFAERGVDRIFPWPGDRPWNFVLHDGERRRVDLHLYEPLPGGPVHYGSVLDPFTFPVEAIAGRGTIAGAHVRCESPEWAVRWRTDYAASSERPARRAPALREVRDPASRRLLIDTRGGVQSHSWAGLQPA